MSRIAQSPEIVQAVTRIAKSGDRSKEAKSEKGGDDGNDELDGDIYGLAKRVSNALSEIEGGKKQ